MQTLIAQERERFDRQRRRTYQIAGLLGSGLVAIDIAVVALSTEFSFFARAMYLVNDLFLIAFSLLIVWLISTHRGSLTVIERSIFWLFSAESLLFNGIVPVWLGQTLAQRLRETINDDIWFLIIIGTLGFHIFRNRHSVIIVGALYLLSTLIVAGQTLVAGWQRQPIDDGLQSLYIYGMGAVLLCFIYIASRYRSQAERLHTEFTLLEELAFVDMLTDLPNRRRCEQALQGLIARHHRYGEPLTVCLWDVDHFKQINDTFGHEQGDQVLRALARLGQQTIRATDLLGRWGGEEFCLLLPRTTLAEAAALAERLRQRVMNERMIQEYPVTASFGLAEYHAAETPVSLLRRADQALYAAKAAGRNRVCIAEAPIQSMST